ADRAAAESRLRQVEAEATTASANAQAAEAVHHDAELRDTLEAWLRTASLAMTASDFRRHEEQLQADYATTLQRATSAKKRLHTATICAVIGVVIALSGLAYAIYSQNLLISGIAILIGVLGIVPSVIARPTAQQANAVQQEALLALRVAQERREDARLAGADPALLAKQQATLAQLGVAGELSPGEARRMHDDLARRVTITTPEARDQAQRSAIDAATARQQANSIRETLTAAIPGDAAFTTQALADAEDAAGQAEVVWQEAHDAAQVAITVAGLPANADEVVIAAERARTEQEIAQLRRQVESLAGEQGDTHRQELETLLLAITARWNGLCTRAVERGIWSDALDEDLIPLSYTHASHERQVQETSFASGDMLLATLAPRLDHSSAWMRSEMDRLDSPGAHNERDRLIGQIGELRKQCEQVEQHVGERNDELAAVVAKRGIAYPSQTELSLEALIGQWPLLANVEGDAATLQAQVRDA
ncbi:MAG TPA: hypothetical protein VKB76_14075, partial [Ktedonobacterales bacterium]|nr:hypothetical protein [Ktedonobacterales bacterium]